MAAPRIGFEDCLFYHSIELPGHGLVKALWDLRGREDRYLGFVPLAGKTVLEIGPASGGLTAYMEAQGATVTCLETSEELGIDILPHYAHDVEGNKGAGKYVLQRVTNAWHYTKDALVLKATIHYGDVNTPTNNLGPFDISFVGAILVHCKSPFSVVHQACNSTKETVVVTDILTPGLETMTDSLMRFNAHNGVSLIDWWRVSPGAIANMLSLHGFTDITTIFHEQKTSGAGDQPFAFTKMFTVVGRKP